MLIQDIEFFDFETAGAMTSRLSTDPQRLQELISLNIGLILIVVVGMLSSIILALAVAWKLALVAIFGCIPPLFLAGFMRMRLEMTSQDRARKPYQESARFVSEAVGAIRTVSSLGLESKILASYADRLHTSVRTSYKRTAYTNILFCPERESRPGRKRPRLLVRIQIAIGRLLQRREVFPCPHRGIVRWSNSRFHARFHA